MKPTISFPLLQPLPEVVRQDVIAKMKMQKVNDGETIYERGENCTDAFFIFEGKVKFCAYGPEGEMAFYWRRQPGEIFGFYSAITGLPQTTTALAIGETVVGRMTGADFMALVLGHRALSEYMLKLVTHMLRAESNRIAHLITMDASLRLVAELLDHAAASGGNVITMPARVEMAARLGMTRETLARHLSNLSKKGLISLERDRILIVNTQQLADLLG